MKQLFALMSFLFLFFTVSIANAATTVSVDDEQQKVTVQQTGTTAVPAQTVTTQTVQAEPAYTVVQPTPVVQAVAVQPSTPVVVVRDEDTKEFEGEITNIEYSKDSKGQILVRDISNGRDRRVTVKQGMIGTYKVGDFVRISLMNDMREAKMIETIRNAQHFDGAIVNVIQASNQILVRDERGETRTVLVTPSIPSFYRTGDRVRVYILPDRQESGLIRIYG